MVNYMGLDDYFEIWAADAYTGNVTDTTEALLARLAGGADPLSLIGRQKKLEGGA